MTSDGGGGREDNVTTSNLNFPSQAVSSSTVLGAMQSHEGDLEAGKADVAGANANENGGCADDDDDDDGFSDPFDIANTKTASVQALKRWRVRPLDATRLH